MRISFRIYRSHDYDLMVLHRTKSLSLAKAAEQALRAEACGDERFKIYFNRPAAQQISVPCSACITLDVNDPDICRLYYNAKSGVRCSWIKNLIRKYMHNENVSIYAVDDIDVIYETPENKKKEREKSSVERKMARSQSPASLNAQVTQRAAVGVTPDSGNAAQGFSAGKINQLTEPERHDAQPVKKAQEWQSMPGEGHVSRADAGKSQAQAEAETAEQAENGLDIFDILGENHE